MTWKRMMSWLMGLLLVCSGPLASGCDAACQLHGPHSCCRSVVSSACGMLRCSSSRACNGIARQQTADTATLYDRLPVAAQASAEPISAKFQPGISLGQSILRFRLSPPLQTSSGFDPLLVSLQI
ncbi:MAG: hypothetical protein WBF45_15000 [Acidobacteriaceae bacterium]